MILGVVELEAGLTFLRVDGKDKMSPVKNPSDFTVAELKERLKNLGLSVAGSKNDLIGRLMEADPEGGWLRESVLRIDAQNEMSQGGEASANASESRSAVEMPGAGGAEVLREMEIIRREKELLERELALARREVEFLREREGRREGFEATERRVDRGEARRGADLTGAIGMAARPSITAIAELLAHFDGASDSWEVWEKQVRLLASTYFLQDEMVKILIGAKLKGRAAEWFRSKPEHLEMSTNDLLAKMKAMFDHRPNKLARKKEFEGRVWRRSEAFAAYMHDKIILANRVPVGEDDLVDYIVDGISDLNLQDQARIQGFTTTASLLRAFEKVTLRPRGQRDGNVAPAVRPDTAAMGRGARGAREGARPRGGDGGGQSRPKRCYNCGGQNHISANCPTKESGVKCFRCGERGHIAARCAEKASVEKTSCVVSGYCDGKYYKNVCINTREISAMIDTGSDMCLMRAGCHGGLNAPLKENRIYFRGVGSNNNETLGEFDAEVRIDDDVYTIRIRIVSDELMRYDFIIGADFLRTVDVIIKKGEILISKPRDDPELPEIFQIDCVREASELDVAHLDGDHRSALENMVRSYVPDKTRDVNIKMKLILKDDEPVYQRARRCSEQEKRVIKQQVDEWMCEGIVRPSLSEYASPVVLVKKKSGAYRLCVDYRRLNQKIVKDRYPLPLIDDQLDRLQGAKIFSTLDLANGFFHVDVDESSRKFTAFIIPDGQYEFLRMPFGLCNSPAVFQRFVNATFRDFIGNGTVLTYMDDLIVPSENYEDAFTKLQRIFDRASQAGLTINWDKCQFLKTRVEFLGHVIESGDVRPLEAKTDAVARFPEPKNVKQVQSFLGLSGYFRKFIYNYSLMARPLTNLLRKDVVFRFEEEERNAFDRLKAALINKPVLKLYRVNATTELHTDASKHGYGAILLQRDDNQLLRPVYYASGRTTPAEEKYSSYELEVLAIIKSLKKFRVYLIGIPFKIVTDCKAFSLTMNKKDLCVRVARWALQLEEFNYVIEHRPGKAMTHVDALSRNPLPVCMLSEREEGIAARIRKVQREEAHLREIIELAEAKKAVGFVMRAGVLFKIIDDEERMVVPRSMRSQIIKYIHDRGHLSVTKTEQLVAKEYWIQGLKAKVERVVHSCVPCILAERKHGKREGLLRPIEKGEVPLDTFHLDHMGPLPSTRKQYRHILVVVDSFTKFVWLYAVKTTNTAEVLHCLARQAHVFGNPRRIISDRGSAFTSGDFQEYCKTEGIQHVLTTTGMPRANGQVERVNRTLIPVLTKLSAPRPEEWHKHLNTVQRYLNATPHRSIGTTPFRLLVGTDMKIKDDISIRELIEKETISIFKENRDEIRTHAKENIRRVQEENRRGFDKRRKPATAYTIGDLVAIKRTQAKPGLKFAPKYLGPYRVTRALRNDRYIVEKVGEHEGPYETSTAAEYMKRWVDENDEVTTDVETDAI